MAPKCNRAYTIQDLYNGFPRCLKPYHTIMTASSWLPKTNTIDLVSEHPKQVTTRFYTSRIQFRTSYLKRRQMEVVKEIPFITQGSLQYRRTHVIIKRRFKEVYFHINKYIELQTWTANASPSLSWTRCLSKEYWVAWGNKTYCLLELIQWFDGECSLFTDIYEGSQ